MAKVELEELVVKLAVENQELINGLKASQKTTDAALKGIQKSVEELADKSEKEMSRWQRIMDTALGFVGGEAILGGINAAKDALGSLFESMAIDGIKGAIETEDAMNKLSNSLAMAGQYSKETADAMEEFAGSIQATTKYGDDAVLGAASLIEALGQLDRDGLQKATQAAIDLSAALGIDLQTAAQLVGKAAAGEVGTFGRYGIAIQEGATKAETFANALDLINSRFAGSAVNQVKTFSGGLELIKNNYGDLTKTAMQAVTQNQAVLNVFDSINKILIEGTDAASNQKQALKEFVAQGLIAIIEASQYVVTALDAIVRAGGLVIDGLQIAFSGVAAILLAPFTIVIEKIQAGFEKLGLDVPESIAGLARESRTYLEGFKASAMDAADSAYESLNGESMLGGMVTRLGEMKIAAENGFEAIKNGTEAVIEPTNNAAIAVTQLSEAQKKMIEDGRALAEELIINMQTDNDIRTEMLAAQYEKELEMLLAAREAERLTEEQHKTAIAALDDKYFMEAKTRADKFKKDEEKRQKDSLDLENKSMQGRLAIASNVAQLISAVSTKESKAAFFAQKAVAIAQSIVATNLAAAQALAVPPAPNLGLAAMARTSGMINTAAIAATAITGLEKGIDEVPGIGFKDNFPAILAPGERVVPRETNQDLKEFLARGGTGGGGEQIVFRHVFDFAGGMEKLVEVVESKMVERIRTGQSVLFT
jgi:hypothetical protein